MPISATVPLENILEPRVGDSLNKPLLNGEEEEEEDRNQGSGLPRHLYVSPPLYATPEQAPLPEDSFLNLLYPSPYVLNHKGRRDGSETKRVGAAELPTGDNDDDDQGLDANDDVNGDDNDDDEGFLGPRCESMSVGENDFSVGRQVDSHSFASGQGDFFDANDDFSSSDGSVSNVPFYSSRIESELRATRLGILEEIERRKSAEEALALMCSQYEMMSNVMSQAGLTFPSATDNMQIDQFLQEVLIARFVAEAVGRGQARAEAEEAAATIIESKDQEISRLQNRLQYYETVNHEMSQRKLVAEVARRQQKRKQRSRRRWMWSFMGLSVAIGASFVAYSYIPHSSKHLSSPKSSDC